MKKTLLLSLTSLTLSGAANAQDTTFAFTGTEQMYVVPGCVTEIEIVANGAQGNDAVVGGATGGLGGMASGRLVVTPGDVLYIYVGGQNGYNGGGNGGQNGNTVFGGPPGILAANGGGASDVRFGGTTLNDRILVAGGGGGAGENGVWPGCQVAGPSGNGGAGGGMVGGNGGYGVGTPCNCQGGGGDSGLGGSQVAGGIHGAYYGNTACLRSSWGPGEDGSWGLGGNGSLLYHNGTGGGGGGGGGYYGGGSGGNGSDTTPGGGGGGGSSYLGTLTTTSDMAGVNSGDGSVSIYIISSGVPTEPTGLTGNTTACEGDVLTFSINAQAGVSGYTWTVPNGGTIVSGQGTTTITATMVAGTGNVEVTADASCGSSTPAMLSVTVYANPTLALTASNTTPCVYNSVVQLAGTPAGGTWSGTGVTGATFNPAVGVGSYDLSYTYTDGNGCTSTDILTITVDGCASIEETAALGSISVFPNPATTEFNVVFGAELNAVTFELIDAQGRLAYSAEKAQISSQENVVIPVAKLPKGIYTLRITSAEGTRNVAVSVAN
jgi:hypothetical protein